MPLSKGFLSRPAFITNYQLVFGLIWWLVISYILYYAFSLTRELLRGFTGFHLYAKQLPLLLSAEETQLYNFFYAAVASSVGFMWSAGYMLRQTNQRNDPKKRLVVRRAINDTGLISWSYLFWFAKIAFTFGVFYLQFPFQLDIDILRDLPFFLILFPITMLLSVWPQLQLVFGKNKWRYLIGIFCVFSIMSFGFSFKNVVNPNLINEIKINQSIVYKYNLSLPQSLIQFPQNTRYTCDIFLVKDSIDGNKPLLFFNDIHNQITYDELANNLFAHKMRLDSIDRDKSGINLFIDKNIPIYHVDTLKQQLRKLNEENIQLSTVRKYGKFSSNNPYYKHHGFTIFQLPYYPAFEAFLDSAEKLDFSKYSIRLTNSMMYRGFSKTDKKYIVKLFVDEDQILLNGKKFAKEKAASLMYKVIKKYPERAVIIFERKDTITYDRYIEMLDLIFTQYMRIRQEYALTCFGESYNELYYEDDYHLREIQFKYPMQILEWTPEEKRLIKLIQKQKRIQK